MRDPLRNVSVRYKLALTFAGVCLLAFGVGGYLVSRSAREALEGEIHQRLRFQSRGIATALETDLRALGQRARDFASDGYIRVQAEALLAPRDEGDDDRVKREQQVQCETDLRTHLVANKLAIVPAFVDLALSAGAAREPFVADPENRAWTAGLPEDAFADADWFSGLLPPDGAERAPTLVVATPLRSLAGGRRLGSLLVHLDTAAWITGALSGMSADVADAVSQPALRLIDGAGRSLAIRGLSPIGWRYAEPGSAEPLPERTQARGVFVHRHPIAPAGPGVPGSWTLETVLDSSEAFAAVAGFQARILIVGVALTAAACLLLFFPMRFLARPLRELQDAARAIRAGDFGARVHSESSDEVGELADAFNLMAEAIEERAGRLQAAADTLAQRKDELRRERDRLDAVIRSMRDGLIVLDADGRPEVWNAAAQPLLAAPERLGMSSHRLCQSPHTNGVDIAANGTDGSGGTGGAVDAACRHCLFDASAPPRSCLVDVGASVYEVHTTSLAPERDRKDGRAGRVLVARDVTDRVSQDERQMHQERLAVLGEVAAVVAHELNNPLAAIRMFAQMAASKLPPDSPLREDVAVIERNTHTCSRTIRELLDYATGAGPEVDSVDVHATLEDVARFLRAMRERKDVDLALELDAADPVVVGDEVQLRQVFVNLVMNALQAADDRGGRVAVRTRIDGTHLVVEVQDDGPGIPAEVAEHVFRPFYTTKPRGAGTGLGLPTARRIAEIQGGGLELVDARPGHTTFSARLLRGNA